MSTRKRFVISLISVMLLTVQGRVTTLSAAPLNALIIDGQNLHSWQETTPLLKKFLEETGLFSVDVATSPPQGGNMSGFNPNFSAYNVVVMNYQGDDWPEKVNNAFEKYMAEGGGLVIVHGASLTFPKWKEFNEMIGLGGWGGRDEKDGPYLYWKDGQIVRDMSAGPGGHHGAYHAFSLVVRDQKHPITKGIPTEFAHAPDELYSKLRGPAKNLTVLATAFDDPAQKASDDPTPPGVGRHEPVLMTITYGKGRVFHTTLGHDASAMKSVAFIVTFQRGAEWASTGKVAQKVPADFPGPDRPKTRP